MSRREQALVGMMIVAVLYGGFTWVLGERSGKDTKIDHESSVGALSFVDDARERMGQWQMCKHEEHVLNQATGPWSPSPFDVRRDRVQAVREPPTDLLYNGFFRIGDTRLAIVNGREYRLGERIDATDLIVETIEPDRVGLISTGGGRRIVVMLHESEQRGS